MASFFAGVSVGTSVSLIAVTIALCCGASGWEAAAVLLGVLIVAWGAYQLIERKEARDEDARRETLPN